MLNEQHILKVNLTTKSFDIEEISKDIIKKYIGGRGLGSYLIYKALRGGIDPLGEENHIIITAGPASGTRFPFSSKINLTTKSPLTGAYLYTISSGLFAHHMRKAGLWAIDIGGVAPSPTYMVIEGDNLEFKDASRIWGVETAKAQEMMITDLGVDGASALSIGPAGEQLINYASVFTEGSHYRCFARGGAGAVMGSKQLKGIVIKENNREVLISDKNGYQKKKIEISKLIKNDFKNWVDNWRRYETGAELEILNTVAMIPTRNWRTGQFEGWRGIDKSTTKMGWPKKGRACAPYCLVGGCRDVEVKNGPYRGAHSDLEWETIYAFGSTCGVDKMEAVIAASQICDEYGIDTMTAGVTIGFAMECFEKGLINKNDTDGIELRFGNDQAMINALKKIVKQEGFGLELAKGTKGLSEQINGSESFAMHSKGMELGGYECRGLNAQALQFAVSPRGGCHHTFGLPAWSEAFDHSGLNVKGKGNFLKNAAISRIIRDCMILCSFLSIGPPDRHIVSDSLIADLTTLLFDENWSTNELKNVGTRVICQERLFNTREGFDRKDDALPERLLKEPKPDGPAKGAVVPLDELLDEFYEAMDFDLKSGSPKKSLLRDLEIEK